MVHLIFEDHKEQPLSQFIMEAYGDFEDKYIHFAGANSRVLRKLTEKWCEQDMYLVYFDVVPDNPSVNEEFEKLIECIDAKGYDNVYVFKIPCIEYFVVKAFGEESNKDMKLLLNKGLYKETDFYHEHSKGIKSFEKYCKYVASRLMARCKRVPTIREAKQDDSLGKYYCEDCMCRFQVSDTCTECTKEEKASILVSKLPVVLIPRSLKGKMESITVEEIEKRMKQNWEQYRLWYNFYREADYII